MADLNGDRKPDLATMDGSEGWVDIGAYLGSGVGGLIDACTTTVSRNLEPRASPPATSTGTVATMWSRPAEPRLVTSSNGRSVTVPPGPPRIYLCSATPTTACSSSRRRSAPAASPEK